MRATYGRRVAATLIDLVISSIAFFAVFLGFALVAGVVGTTERFDDDYGIPGAAILGYLLAILLPILLMLRPGRGNSQTLGKELGKVILGITVLWTIVDDLWPLADARDQALHDKMASTVVLDASAPPGAAAPPQPTPFAA